MKKDKNNLEWEVAFINKKQKELALNKTLECLGLLFTFKEELQQSEFDLYSEIKSKLDVTVNYLKQ